MSILPGRDEKDHTIALLRAKLARQEQDLSAERTAAEARGWARGVAAAADRVARLHTETFPMLSDVHVQTSVVLDQAEGVLRALAATGQPPVEPAAPVTPLECRCPVVDGVVLHGDACKRVGHVRRALARCDAAEKRLSEARKIPSEVMTSEYKTTVAAPRQGEPAALEWVRWGDYWRVQGGAEWELRAFESGWAYVVSRRSVPGAAAAAKAEAERIARAAGLLAHAVGQDLPALSRQEAANAEAEHRKNRSLSEPRFAERPAPERTEGRDHHGAGAADERRRQDGGRGDAAGRLVRAQPDGALLRSGDAVQRGAEGRALELAAEGVEQGCPHSAERKCCPDCTGYVECGACGLGRTVLAAAEGQPTLAPAGSPAGVATCAMSGKEGCTTNAEGGSMHTVECQRWLAQPQNVPLNAPLRERSDAAKVNAPLRVEQAPGGALILSALRVMVKSCPKCNGTGRYWPHCYKCDDSTWDHADCPKEEDCAACRRGWEALAAYDRASDKDALRNPTPAPARAPPPGDKPGGGP